jgi:hypothetical protein
VGRRGSQALDHLGGAPRAQGGTAAAGPQEPAFSAKVRAKALEESLAVRGKRSKETRVHESARFAVEAAVGTGIEIGVGRVVQVSWPVWFDRLRVNWVSHSPMAAYSLPNPERRNQQPQGSFPGPEHLGASVVQAASRMYLVGISGW